jgi:hypothetical protein
VRHVLEGRNVRLHGDLVDDEILRRAAVDAGGIDADRRHLAILDQRAGRIGAVAGEVQVRRVAGRRAPEVACAVRPAITPAGAQQHDDPGGDPAVALLPRGEVRRFQPIVGIGGGLGADIEDDRRRHQLG